MPNSSEPVDPVRLTRDDGKRLGEIARSINAGIDAGDLHPDFAARDVRYLRKLSLAALTEGDPAAGYLSDWPAERNTKGGLTRFGMFVHSLRWAMAKRRPPKRDSDDWMEWAAALDLLKDADLAAKQPPPTTGDPAVDPQPEKCERPWPHETPPGRCVHWPKTCADAQAQCSTAFKFCAHCSPSSWPSCQSASAGGPVPDRFEEAVEVLAERLQFDEHGTPWAKVPHSIRTIWRARAEQHLRALPYLQKATEGDQGVGAGEDAEKLLAARLCEMRTADDQSYSKLDPSEQRSWRVTARRVLDELERLAA